MEKTFRDILAEFLEENATRGDDSPSHGTPGFPSENMLFEPTWRPNFTQPRGLHAKAYPTRVVPKEALIEKQNPPEKPKPTPRPEIVIPLEKLPNNEHSCVKFLIAMGADNLTQGLSDTRLKKAHRRLAKTIHPDRLAANARPEDIRTANESFMKLTKAYNTLKRFLKRQTPATTAA